MAAVKDPLEKFRARPLANAAPPVEAVAPAQAAEYVAFGVKDRVERLKIRRANGAMTRTPAYLHLLDIVHDGEFGTNIALIYTFLMVVIKGKHLQHLIMALETSTADFVQEFDARQWGKPQDTAAAFIESIEVLVKNSADAVADAERAPQAAA